MFTLRRSGRSPIIKPAPAGVPWFIPRKDFASLAQFSIQGRWDVNVPRGASHSAAWQLLLLSVTNELSRCQHTTRCRSWWSRAARAPSTRGRSGRRPGVPSILWSHLISIQAFVRGCRQLAPSALTPSAAATDVARASPAATSARGASPARHTTTAPRANRAHPSCTSRLRRPSRGHHGSYRASRRR